MTNERVYELADAISVLLKRVCERKLRYFGHIMRQPWDSIEGSLMTGLVEGKQGRRRQRISWIDNVLMWTWLTRTVLMSTIRSTEEAGQHWSIHDGNMT